MFTHANSEIYLGLAFLFLSLAVFGGHLYSGDEVAYYAVAFHLVQGELPTVPEFLDGFGVYGPSGNYFSKFGLGMSLLVIPFLFLSFLIAVIFPEVVLSGAQLKASALLVNPLLGSIGVYLFHQIQRRLGIDRETRWISTVLFLLNGLWLAYSRTLFSELAVATFVLLTLHAQLSDRHSSDLLIGIACGGLLLLRIETVLLIMPVLGVYWFNSNQLNMWSFTVPTVSLVTIAVYNYLRFKNPMQIGMGDSAVETFSTPILKGVLGQFVAPGNGFFVYCPYLIIPVFIFAIDRTLSPRKLSPLFLAYFSGALFYIGVHSMWHSWMGGWSWGPRRMIPLLPLIHLSLPVMWKKMSKYLKLFVVSLFILSIVVNIGGLVTDFNEYYKGTFYSENVLFDPSYSQIYAQNEGLLDGRISIDVFWITVFGPVRGILMMTFLLGLSATFILLSRKSVSFASTAN